MRTSCKRLLTLILAVAMLVGLLPTVALATESHAGNISPEPQKLIPSNYEPDPKFTEFIKGLVGKLRFGVLHSHTAEYSDGAGTLEEAYAHAQSAEDMDFLFVTDHSHYFDTFPTATTSSYYDLSSLSVVGNTTKWEAARATALSYNTEDFIAGYGFEMTWAGGPGHISTFNTYGPVSRNNTELNTKTDLACYNLYNDLMVNANLGLDVDGNPVAEGVKTKYLDYAPVVSQLNEPGEMGNFNDFSGYSSYRDSVINLIEVAGGEGAVGGSRYERYYDQYDLALSKGWHVAPTNNQSNHKGNWGDSNTARTVIFSNSFNEGSLYTAMSMRQVYSTEDQNLKIFYTLNEEFMGTVLRLDRKNPVEKVQIYTYLTDPDGEALGKIEVIGENGETVYLTETAEAEYELCVELLNTDKYYYIRVTQADGDIAVTAPVWVDEALPGDEEPEFTDYIKSLIEKLRFGVMHSHTAEYSDGAGTLEEAYAHAQSAEDVDFLIVTDHSHYFDTRATATASSYYDLSSLTGKWEEARATALAYTTEDFVAAYGYEMTWSGGPGHMNTYNTYGPVSRNNAELNNKTDLAGYNLYNDLMVNANLGLDVDGKPVAEGVKTKYLDHAPVVSQFNHPGSTFGNFNDFSGYSTDHDSVINLIEVAGGEGPVGGYNYERYYEQYDLALSKGWHVAPTNNQNNHKGNWGDANTARTVILADSFNEGALYTAMSMRRVYSTEDQNLRILYTLNEELMGSILPLDRTNPVEKVQIYTYLTDPDGEALGKLEVIGENGETLYFTETVEAEYELSVELPNTDKYYYIRVTQSDGDIAVTAPVWVDEHIHAWDEGEVVNFATCEEEGLAIYTCTHCGETENRVIPATGHTYELTETTAPRCLWTGANIYTCTACGHSYVEVLPALGHSYDKGVVTSPATCTKAGIRTYTCKTCGDTITETIPAFGHSFDEGAVTQEPACGIPGVFTYTCEHCGMTRSEELPAKTHLYILYADKGLEHSVKCLYCSSSYTEAHDFRTGDCVCGATESGLPTVLEDLQIYHNLNLAGDIAINYMIPAKDLEGCEDFYMECLVPDYEGNKLVKTSAVRLTGEQRGDYYYFILDGLVSFEMNNEVQAQLVMRRDGKTYLSKTDRYSIATYAYSQLKGENKPEALKTVCANLLQYGAKAQLWKEYRTDALADAGMTEEHRSYLTAPESVTFGNNKRVLGDLADPKVSFAGMGLRLDSKIVVRYVVDLSNYAGDPQTLSLRITYKGTDGTTETAILTELESYSPSKNYYAFSFDGLLAAELRTLTSAAVYEGDTRISETMEYSADTYGNGRTGTVLTVVQAMIAYSDSAKAYFVAK